MRIIKSMSLLLKTILGLNATGKKYVQKDDFKAKSVQIYQIEFSLGLERVVPF